MSRRVLSGFLKALLFSLVACGGNENAGVDKKAGRSDPPREAPGAQDAAIEVYSRFVVLGSVDAKTVPYARIILDAGAGCPEIRIGERRAPMIARDNPGGFPVLVCEAVVEFDRELAILLESQTLRLPEVPSRPSRVLVFGDTGCHTRDCPAGTPAEPFKTLADLAAESSPELIVHLGDYNYRGTGGKVTFTLDSGEVEQWPYDAGDGTTLAEDCLQSAGAGFWSMNAPNSSRPDSWDAWRDDFILPAQKLLLTAPAVFARGNHELCSRAGPGWFYFLDPSSNLTGRQSSCPQPDPSKAPIDNVLLTEPYAVTLANLNLLVLDSANACDAFANETFTERYEEQLEKLEELASSERPSWLITHRPLWGVGAYEAGKSTSCTDRQTYRCINQMLQSALDDALDGRLPDSVELLLAGHQHRFQSLSFTDGRPPILVVGNSGVALENDPPIGTHEIPIDGATSTALSVGATVNEGGVSKKAFGFLRIELAEDGGWKGTLQNPAERLTLAECSSASEVACRMAAGVEPEG